MLSYYTEEKYSVMNRPEKNEYDPYYETYVSLVGDGDIVDTLERQGSRYGSFSPQFPRKRALTLMPRGSGASRNCSAT